MKVFTNEKTIRRNAKIGNYASMIAFGLMLIGMYFSFQLTNEQVARENQLYNWFMAGALFVGFILFQVGTYFMNRFGRRPRPDEALTATLKGFTKDYTLYNHLTPVSHLLVGPAGVWILACYYQRGKISYEGGRWKQKGGGFALNYMKIFGQEGLGRPDLEVKSELETMTAALKKSLGEDAPPVNIALVFTDTRAEVDAEDAPHPTLKLKDLKEYLRKYAKANPLPAAEIQRVTAVLPEESIA